MDTSRSSEKPGFFNGSLLVSLIVFGALSLSTLILFHSLRAEEDRRILAAAQSDVQQEVQKAEDTLNEMWVAFQQMGESWKVLRQSYQAWKDASERLMEKHPGL